MLATGLKEDLAASSSDKAADDNASDVVRDVPPNADAPDRLIIPTHHPTRAPNSFLWVWVCGFEFVGTVSGLWVWFVGLVCGFGFGFVGSGLWGLSFGVRVWVCLFGLSAMP